jgi:hypothetical protein
MKSDRLRKQRAERKAAKARQFATVGFKSKYARKKAAHANGHYSARSPIRVIE